MKNKTKNQSKLFFDLRSGSVSATYSILTPRPSIIFSKTEYVSFNRIHDTSSFIDQCMHTLELIIESTLTHLIKNNLIIPETIDIIYTSPWFTGHVFRKTTVHDTDQIMTEDSFSEQIKNSANQAKSQLDSLEQIIETEILSVSLNGYTIHNPVGKHYKKSTFSSYVSGMNTVVRERIEEIIIKHFPHRTIRHRTLPLVITRALPHVRPGYTGYLIVIHGEATDVCSYKQGFLAQHTSFPYGSHVPLKKLSNNPVSKDIYSLIGNNVVVPTKRGQEKEIIRSTYKEWVNAFNESIKDAPASFGNNIIITSEDSVACTYVKNILKDNESAFNVEILDKRHCIGHFVEANVLSMNTHTLSLIEACGVQ